MALKKLRSTFYQVIRTISDGGTPLNRDEIQAALPNIELGALLSHGVAAGYFKAIEPRKGERLKRYDLTKLGRDIAADHSGYELTGHVARQTPKKYKKRKPDVVPLNTTKPLNLDPEAESAMDFMGGLVSRNNNLREAILKACTTLAAQIGMRLVPIEEESQQKE